MQQQKNDQKNINVTVTSSDIYVCEKCQTDIFTQAFKIYRKKNPVIGQGDLIIPQQVFICIDCDTVAGQAAIK